MTIPTHAQRSIDRAASYIKDKPKFQAFIAAFTAEFSSLEDLFTALKLAFTLETAEGSQLDMLGEVVGQPRNGLDDDLYRRYIQARIKVNLSSGTIQDIYNVFGFLIVSGSTMRIVEGSDAEFVLHLDTEPVTSDEAEAFYDFLQAAKAAAVRAVLGWFEADESEVFCFDDGPGLGFGDSSNAATGGDFAGAV
jgi:hypothetical protein